MNRVTLNKINEINSFLSSMNAADKAMPLRLCNTGFDLYKIRGLREYRSMTTVEFLKKVASLDNIPRPLGRLADAVMSVMTQTGTQQPVGTVASIASIASVAQTEKDHTTCMLPINIEKPFFEQADEVIDTLIKGMATVNEHCENTSRCLSLGFDKGMNDDQVAVVVGLNRERIRQIRTKFQKELMQGSVPEELKREYGIRNSFISLAEAIIPSIVNKSAENICEHFGNLTEEKTKFILDMYGLKVSQIRGVRFILSKNGSNKLIRLADKIRMQLKKEFDYVTVSSLIGNLTPSEATFVKEYLRSMPQMYEFNDDRTSVRMVGEELLKATRQARIIFEAEKALSIEEITRRYEDLYSEEMGILQTSALNQMGFSPMTKSGSWRFGTRPIKVQQIIREIFTPTRPIATFNTILKAIQKEGYEYPLNTIRTYITEIATPENKQPDMFCLKGYCHLYPNYSWRSYRKEPA